MEKPLSQLQKGTQAIVDSSYLKTGYQKLNIDSKTNFDKEEEPTVVKPDESFVNFNISGVKVM